jgi:hypothetical protein
MLLDQSDRSEAMRYSQRGLNAEPGVPARYGSAPIMPLAWVIVSSHAR